MKKIIPVFDFTLGVKEKEFVNDCLETSFISQGSYVKDFEKKFKTFQKFLQNSAPGKSRN